MACNAGPDIIEDGLVLCLDAANINSYPKSGTTWSDLAGANDGTLNNMDGANFSSDNRGTLSFDGTNEYIGCGISPMYSSSLAEFTFCSWAYVDVSTFDGTLKVICATAIDPLSGGFWVGFDDRNSTHSPINGVAWNTKNSNGYSRGKTSSNAIPSDGWYNVVLSYSSSTGVTCYINSHENTIRSQTQTGDFTPRNNPFEIARGPTDMSSAWYFAGSISSIQLYNRALTADEVRRNYEATAGRYT